MKGDKDDVHQEAHPGRDAATAAQHLRSTTSAPRQHHVSTTSAPAAQQQRNTCAANQSK